MTAAHLIATPTLAGYLAQDGAPLRSAMAIIGQVHPHSRLAPGRSGAIRRALAAWLAAGKPAQPSQPLPGSSPRDLAIHRLLTADFWQRCDVLSGPVHYRDHRKPIGITVDVIARIHATGRLAVMILQTSPMGPANLTNIRAELGAAIHAASMAEGEEITKAVSIVALSESCKAVPYPVDECCLDWHHALDIDAWNERRLSGQPAHALPGTLTETPGSADLSTFPRAVIGSSPGKAPAPSAAHPTS